MNPKQLKKRKKMIYDVICSKSYVPMRGKEIAILLDIPKERRKDLQDTLDSLLQDNKITMDNRGRYMKKRGPAKQEKKDIQGQTIKGTFISHPKGFGFVEVEGGEQDYFIPEEYTGSAFHKDEVEILPLANQRGRRPEAKVVAITGHGLTQIVGTYQQERSFGFVKPDLNKIEREIFIAQKNAGEAKDGQKVVVQMTSYGGHHRSPEGKVVEVLGYSREPGVDVLSIAKSMELPMEFPEKVANQAKRVPDHVQDGDRDGRTDLTDLMMVTIDGEDARDLDDAVSLYEEDGLYHLGVHIADVSNYVQANSALDREALKRGTSVYLVDRVIPMLPVELSNGICSLNAGQDRLALSCLMTFDASGKRLSHELVESVIHVNRRMSYTEVKKILGGEDEALTKECGELVPMFFKMAELSKKIRKNRQHRGSIDFDFPECKIILGETGHPIEIRPYERNVATDMIEDFMLSANEAVASEYCKREIPFVYRVHENPDPEKVEQVLTLIHALGMDVKKAGQEMTPGEIQEVLAKLKGKPYEDMVSRLLLRSMKRARYTTECSGHFGLAAKYYCHFTSPIRRYPDLQIHRIIKDSIRGRLKPEKIEKYQEMLEDVASQSSLCERRAEEAERETDKIKKAEYMSYHLEEVFEGRISGVTAWGVYVELDNTVEGMVRLQDMYDDYYHFDEEHYRIVGEHTGKVYGLGDTVRVMVEDANVTAGTIDFSFTEETPKKRKGYR